MSPTDRRGRPRWPARACGSRGGRAPPPRAGRGRARRPPPGGGGGGRAPPPPPPPPPPRRAPPPPAGEPAGPAVGDQPVRSGGPRQNVVPAAARERLDVAMDVIGLAGCSVVRAIADAEGERL